jgi:molecular chaperone DnaK
MSVAIGIDLGTTNTVVAAVVDGVAVTLEDDQGRRLLPSVVSFHPSSTVLVGEPARERRLIDPENTIYSVKPLLGRPWDSEEVQGAKARFPFQLTQGTKNSTMVVARDVAYALPEISAFVLRRAKTIAEAALGQAVDRAVITVPANFNDLQRASTKIAGKLAGLEVMRILNEPTAAALAYGQSISKAEKIAVYDLGGGTFDATLLDLTGNVFEVLATAGDTALGGDDIDRVIAEKVAIDALRRYNVDPRENPATAARLFFIAEEIKKELSSAYQSKREITGIGHGDGGQPISMPVVVTRAEVEALARPLLERTIEVTKQSIQQVGLSPKDFDRVILVGGSTRMPLVARLVEQLFGRPPHLKVNPDEVVALGAAIQAHALNRTKAAHKRRSASDQLANLQKKATGEQVPTRPPEADPTLGAADVPKAPALPQIDAPGGALGQKPEFFTFTKAPAVISFSQIPQGGAPAPAPPPPPLPARASTLPPPPATKAVPPRPPPVPAARTRTLQDRTLSMGRNDAGGAPDRTLMMPNAPKRPDVYVLEDPDESSDAGDGSAMTQRTPELVDRTLAMKATRPSTKPPPPQKSRAIAGAPARASATQDFVGPKPARSLPPARTPTRPPPPPSAPKVPDLEVAKTAIIAAPAPPPPPPAPPGASVPPDIQGLVMGTNFLNDLDTAGTFGSIDIVQNNPRFKQGSAIATSAAAPLLIDVTPLSLGLETAGGYADVLIPANSPVPCEKTRTFLTANDGQTVVSIRVAQGESTKFGENTRLGDLELTGLRSARRGEVKIEVTFELDADGILNVRARDQDTGRETKATMRLVGTTIDAEDLGAMAERQARLTVV